MNEDFNQKLNKNIFSYQFHLNVWVGIYHIQNIIIEKSIGIKYTFFK